MGIGRDCKAGITIGMLLLRSMSHDAVDFTCGGRWHPATSLPRLPTRTTSGRRRRTTNDALLMWTCVLIRSVSVVRRVRVFYFSEKVVGSFGIALSSPI